MTRFWSESCKGFTVRILPLARIQMQYFWQYMLNSDVKNLSGNEKKRSTHFRMLMTSLIAWTATSYSLSNVISTIRSCKVKQYKASTIQSCKTSMLNFSKIIIWNLEEPFTSLNPQHRVKQYIYIVNRKSFLIWDFVVLIVSFDVARTVLCTIFF